MPLFPRKPQVVLVVGVNGSGKTTTIGKLASQFRAAGKSVVIAAGDTFRAAASEQLQVWGTPRGRPGADGGAGVRTPPPRLRAWSGRRGTAPTSSSSTPPGRLQNRQDLMEELAKIVRVIRKKDPRRRTTRSSCSTPPRARTR
jgi:fused signal recognition particle receptor